LARIGFQPVFSASALSAAAHIADFGITFDHVHVVIVRPPSQVVADTTIAFGPNHQDVTLDLTVAAQSDGEFFHASIDYTNASGIVFHGEGTVQSHPAHTSAPAQDIGVNYVGPGAKVMHLTVSPKTTSLVAPATLTFTVTGTDASNAPVSGPIPVDWASSDPTVATISTSGTLTTTGKRGSVTITATTPSSATDNATVQVSLGASGIVLVSGGGQSGKAGTALTQPAVVQVVASDKIGVPGISVTFTPPVGGLVGASTSTTDANGMASATMTLGRTLGAQSFAAAAGSFTVAIPATASAGDPAAIAVSSGSGQQDTVTHSLNLPLVARVADKFDNPVPNVTVNWARSGGSGSLSSPTSVTGADGQASVSYKLGSVVGADTIVASTAGVSTTAIFTVRGISGTPASIAAFSGNQQAARILSALLPFVVKVTDASSNPVVGATVTWTAVNGTLTASTVTDATGQSSNTMTLGTLAGTASATATVGTKSVQFTVTVQPGVSSKTAIVSLPAASLASGVMTPPVLVALQDAFGNLTTATNLVTISLGANPRGGNLTGTLSRAAVAGIATFNDLMIDSVAAGYTFIATSSGIASSNSAKFAVIPNLLDITPASVDAVFPTVTFGVEAFGLLTGATTLNLTGIPGSVVNVDAHGGFVSFDLNIPGGTTGGVGTISATTAFGTSNALPLEVASVGNATLQLGPSNGGGGGSPYSLDCPAGALATGINVNAGSNVNTIQVICQTITGPNRTFGPTTTTGTVGGAGGSFFALTCPASYVLTGLAGRIGNGGSGVNDQIAAVCTAIIPGLPAFLSQFAGSVFSGSISYQAVCPTGLAVSGIQGGAGNLLDRTQIKCR
jgi:hypothetical protein